MANNVRSSGAADQVGGRPPHDLGPFAVEDLAHSELTAAVRTLAPWIYQLVDTWETYITVGGFPQAVAAHQIEDRESRLALSSGITVAPARSDPALGRTLKRSLMDVIHGESFRKAAWSLTQPDAFV